MAARALMAATVAREEALVAACLVIGHSPVALEVGVDRLLYPASVLEITREAYSQLVGQALDAYPLEACGLIAGPLAPTGGPGNSGQIYYPCRNDAASARVYTLNPQDFMRAEMNADDRDWEINTVVHSHTHSEPYPSPTDVEAAISPNWHYVIVSLKREAPEVRSYRIVDGEIVAEPLTVI